MTLAAFRIGMTQVEIARQVHTTKKDGTAQSDMRTFLKKYFPKARVRQRMSLPQLQKALRQDVVVIVNFTEPVDNVGHYAIVKKITQQEIILLDPLYRKPFVMKLGDFSLRWHSGDSTFQRWCAVVK